MKKELKLKKILGILLDPWKKPLEEFFKTECFLLFMEAAMKSKKSNRTRWWHKNERTNIYFRKYQARPAGGIFGKRIHARRLQPRGNSKNPAGNENHNFRAEAWNDYWQGWKNN